MKKLRILILPFLIFSLFSCGNLIERDDDSDSSDFVVASGTIRLPDENSRHAEFISASVSSRQAFPSAASGTLYYTLTCTNGTVTYEGTVDSSSDTITYLVQVPTGSSTITAKAFSDSDKKQQIYEGTLSLSDVTSSSDLSNKTITLNDIQSGTETIATVSLPILINSGVSISKITASWTVSSGSGSSESATLSSVTSGTTYYFTLSDFATTAATSANTVPGVYDVVFDFYALDSSSNEYLIFQTNQKISASNYLATSSWKGIGADSCINSSGTLEITKTLCDSFLSTSFYIDSSNGSDTSTSGSFSSPFKSIQKAVDVIKSRGTTDACTIYLKGGITATSTDKFTNGSLVEIADSANLNFKIKSYPSTSTFTIDAEGKGRIFYVGSGNTLEIQNVTLSTGSASDSSATGGANGGAICNKGTLTISSKATLMANIAMNNGGAIYNEGTATVSGIVISNIATVSGGGIYNSGTLTLDGCTFTTDTASAGTGGAVYSSKSFTVSGSTVATVDSGCNDFYLDNSSETPAITLSSDFSGTSGTVSARITLASYSEDYQVLTGDGVSETNCGYFSLTDENYTIGADGKLDEAETVYTSWTDLTKAIEADSTYNTTYTIGTLADYNNVGITLNAGDSSKTISILPSEDVSITNASDQTTIAGGYFSFSDVNATIGNTEHKITFGDSSITATNNFMYIYTGGTASFVNCVFQNASEASIQVNGNLILNDCTFNNISASSSGAVYVTSGTATLDSCTFTGCTDYDVYLNNSSSKLVLQGTLNTASIYVADYSNGALITLDIGLTLSSGASPTVKIYSYKSGTTLFASSDGKDISETIRNYFTVTDKSGNSYTINADGTLTQKTVNSMPSATEAANYSSSSPLSSGTYSVSSAADLVNLATIVNNSGLSSSNSYEFDLTSDVDLTDSGFETIGAIASGKHFTGTFDGGNHTIKNLTCSATEILRGGLFAAVEKATIKNLILENVSVSSSKSYVGAICGRTDNETVITNCHVKSGTAASSENNYAGGLVGYNRGVIANCSNAASVSVTAGTVCGGITGVNSETGFIINCSNSGSSSGKGNIGGIAGNNDGLIANSVNSGTVTLTEANGSGGGIAGSNDSGSIVNCVSVGSFSPASNQSSPIGIISNSTADDASYGIYNCYGLGATKITSIMETGTYSSNSEGTTYGCKVLDSSSGWTSEIKIDLYKLSVSRTSSGTTVSCTTENQYQKVGFSTVSEALDYFVEMVDGNGSVSDGTNSWALKTWTTDSSGNPALSN